MLRFSIVSVRNFAEKLSSVHVRGRSDVGEATNREASKSLRPVSSIVSFPSHHRLLVASVTRYSHSLPLAINMKTGIIVAAALARLACAQDFDFGAVLDAPAPAATEPPLVASNATTSAVDSAVVAASISADVIPTTASVTGASASAASTLEPPASGVDKRAPLNWKPKTSTTMKTTTSSSTTSTSTTSQQQTSTTTTSSESACPTTPEEGTYCGFINPEDACAPQPDGYGAKVQPDTVEAFRAYPPFHEEARNAVTPGGYVQTFVDLNASTSANSYITFYTLKSYDVAGCAQHCDDTDLCTAFNIYIERDPSLNPTTNTTDPAFNCPNPASITNYKCSLWGSSIDASSATNEGGYRNEFQVVIVGSNGYDKTNNTTPPTPPTWSPPNKCPGGAISAGGAYHIGSHFFPGPFNPGLCGVYAQAQTAKNRDAARQQGKKSYTPCNMFNAYMVHLNGVPQGTYCSLFDTVLSSKWAGFSGAWSGKNWFGVESSWTYQLGKLDSGKL